MYNRATAGCSWSFLDGETPVAQKLQAHELWPSTIKPIDIVFSHILGCVTNEVIKFKRNYILHASIIIKILGGLVK